MTEFSQGGNEVSESDGYLDLGALKLPMHEGLEITMDMDQETGRAHSIALVLGSSMAEVQIFARAKDELMWPDTRESLVTGLREQGVASEIAIGRFGSEVQCTMPTTDFAGNNIMQSVRFIGIDGDRWFMRLAVSGSATVDETEIAEFDDLISRLEVVRGDGAMSPGASLEFILPE
jgi:Protein of unknown function (DUF3710)